MLPEVIMAPPHSDVDAPPKYHAAVDEHTTTLGYVSLFTSMLLLWFVLLLLLGGDTGLIDLDVDSREIPARSSKASAPSSIFNFSFASSTETRRFLSEVVAGDSLAIFLLPGGERCGIFTHSLRSSRQPVMKKSRNISNPRADCLHGTFARCKRRTFNI